MVKSYSELIRIPSFKERFNYLKLFGSVGEMTFAGHRYLNQKFYSQQSWRKTRREIILRDNGCDLGHEDYPINGAIYIHHINPITIDDLMYERDCVFDPDNLVCVSFNTHNSIHYGTDKTIKEFKERTPHDTCLWR